MLYVLILLCFLGQALCCQAGEGYVSVTNPEDEQIVNNRLQINNILERLPKTVPLNLLVGHPSPVQKIKWSSDNIHIATYTGDNFVRIWNTQTGALIDRIGSAVEIKDFSWAPDGKRIAITHHTNQVWICDLVKVFEMEQAMELLSTEQLAFIESFIVETPLTTFDENQKRMFEKIPDIIKDSLTDQLDLNKKGIRPNPLR